MGNYYEDDFGDLSEEEIKVIQLKRRQNRALTIENNCYRDSNGVISIDWTGRLGSIQFRVPPYDNDEVYEAALKEIREERLAREAAWEVNKKKNL